MAKLKVKEPVKLRSRTTSKGLQSLFLDITIKGERRQEYLGLYLYPEENREAKAKNKETMMFAEAIRAKRVVDIQNRKFGFESNQGEVYFLDYMSAVAMTKSKSTAAMWMAAIRKIEGYVRRGQRLSEIDKEWLNGCRNYLLTKAVSRHGDIGIARNTALGYFNKVIACLNQAYRQGLISNLPHLGLDAVKWEDIEKEYLTMEELKRLIATPSRDTELSRAFIFSCLTGLRVSDVTKLTWKEVSFASDLPRITFTQKKTSKLEYLDITPQALAYMGERGRPEEKVFRFRYGESTGYKLREWADRAGINKHISFHSGRHTFAVMMLELGTDIYTLQKLMGHKKIETTMVYAKILDKSKQQAVLRIPDLSKK